MRKAIRRLAVAVCFACCALFCTACWLWGGYNHIMYDYFKDEKNYREWSVVVADFHLLDYYNKKTYSMYENSELFEYKPFEERKEESIRLLVQLKGEDAEYFGEKLSFELMATNMQEIVKNGGLEEIAIGDTITICATNWVYGDRDWFEVAQVEKDSVYYLDMQTGLKNIVAYMDANRSLL